jgi:hypothetical protein
VASLNLTNPLRVRKSRADCAGRTRQDFRIMDMNISKNTSRNNRRLDKRIAQRVIKAAEKYDLKGCEICGHQPMGREIYPIGKIGKRVVGVCHQHLRRLDAVLSMQFYIEGEVNIKQRKMAEGVSTDGWSN